MDEYQTSRKGEPAETSRKGEQETKTCIPPITGYRQLNQKEVQLMNAIKAEGMCLSGLIDRIVDGGVNADPRWVAIARTELQQGLMALTRAVAKPEGF